MKDKEKQIEEMAKDIPYLTLDRTVFVGAIETKNVSWTLSEEDNKLIAKELISKGWIKPAEDSVVLSREEYEKQKAESVHINIVEKIVENERKVASKETAEKIFDILYQWLDLEEIEDI